MCYLLIGGERREIARRLPTLPAWGLPALMLLPGPAKPPGLPGLLARVRPLPVVFTAPRGDVGEVGLSGDVGQTPFALALVECMSVLMAHVGVTGCREACDVPV